MPQNIGLLPIQIYFNVTKTVRRSVYVYALLAHRVYLIDAGVAGAEAEIARALQGAGRSLAEVAGILLTHTHPDHIGGIAAIKAAAPGCKVYVSGAEQAWLEDIDAQYRARPIPNFYALAGASCPASSALAPGSTLHLAPQLTLDVLNCAGHSHGSIGYFWRQAGVLFTGDAIPLPGDIPVFKGLAASVQTVRRLQRQAGVRCIAPAWGAMAKGPQAAAHLARGLVQLQHFAAPQSRFAAPPRHILWRKGSCAPSWHSSWASATLWATRCLPAAPRPPLPSTTPPCWPRRKGGY